MDRNQIPGAKSMLLLLCTALTAACAQAGSRDHEDGLFLRLSPGYGATTTTLSSSGLKQEVSGNAAAVDVAVGAVIAGNLVLHGTLFGAFTANPDFQENALAGELVADLIATAYGAGLTYYFMPANFYVSSSGGLGRHEFKYETSSFKTEYGLFVDVSVGKEWWISDSWGLGLAGGFQYHSYGDPDLNRNWSGLTYNMRVTATLN